MDVSIPNNKYKMKCELILSHLNQAQIQCDSHSCLLLQNLLLFKIFSRFMRLKWTKVYIFRVYTVVICWTNILWNTCLAKKKKEMRCSNVKSLDSHQSLREQFPVVVTLCAFLALTSHSYMTRRDSSVCNNCHSLASIAFHVFSFWICYIEEIICYISFSQIYQVSELNFLARHFTYMSRCSALKNSMFCFHEEFIPTRYLDGRHKSALKSQDANESKDEMFFVIVIS